MVGIRCEKCVGVLCEVMSAMILPQPIDIVHGAMVYVEPEVENDAIQANLQPQPSPPVPVSKSRGRGLVAIVGDVGGHGDTGSRRLPERSSHFIHANIRYAIALVDVTIKIAKVLACFSGALNLADNNHGKGEEVEKEHGDRVQAFLASVPKPCLVDGNGYKRVHKNPSVSLPLNEVGHLISLWVHGNVLSRREGVNVERIDEPVVQTPFRPVPKRPGRFD